MAEKVRDLRSALERLRNMPGQLARQTLRLIRWRSLPVFTVTSVRAGP